MGDYYTEKTRLPSHTEGTRRGEEWTWKGGKEAGREGRTATARSSTAINPRHRSPIDPRMPQMPPP